jgi:hypothetical protein
MQDTRQYFPPAVSFPGTAAMFKVVSAPEITTSAPGGANQRHGDGDDRRRYEAQQQRDIPGASETGAGEISSGEIRDVSSRPGRLLTPPFGLFLRAALLAHLERTFR